MMIQQEHAEQMLRAAMQAMQQGQPIRTMQLLHEARQIAPDWALPSFLIACEYAENGQYELAEHSFFEALRCEENFPLARFQLGLLQFTGGRAGDASETWRKLDELNPDHPLRRFRDGLEMLALDRFDEAVHALRLGQQSNHDNAPLNADMQRVIDRIAAFQARIAERQQGDQPAENAGGLPDPRTEKARDEIASGAGRDHAVEPEAVTEPSGTAHFLLSRYRKLQ